ncbi:MAG: FAD-linked oxidase C-terminal domain-containing protein, partial [Chloroflexota bacterium]|nr:FAD-linked oxidase C-terminal domain-containing protein [Chloroflexota bacterium]
SGYDLIHLFVGSEGTLGVITEVTLRLRIVPEKMAAVAVFPSMETAAQTIFDINRYGPAPAAIELMDPQIVSYVNRWKEMSLEEAPTLVMEFHGTPAGIQEEVTLIEETCRDNGCLRFDKGVTGSERDRLWAGRREAHNAVKYLNTDHIVEIGDIVMPISKYPAAVAKAYELAEELNVSIATFGHAGDGNLHIEILSRKGDPDDHARAEEFNERIVLYAISVGGTATGEHGVGIGKRKFMSQEHGASLEVMRRIKKLLDPNGIMNPGKIFLAEAVEA